MGLLNVRLRLIRLTVSDVDDDDDPQILRMFACLPGCLGPPANLKLKLTMKPIQHHLGDGPNGISR